MSRQRVGGASRRPTTIQSRGAADAGIVGRTRAMLDYAVKITRDSVNCSEADIEALRAHGFGDEDVYDIIATAALYNYNNRVANAAGHIPDRAFHGAFRETD